MEELLLVKTCKYCQEVLVPCINEGLTCTICQGSSHVRCLKRGSVPGGLAGDLFFVYTCQECSATGTENFARQNLSWLQALVLVLYHMQNKSGGLARNGFFHWRHHIVNFIDCNWDILFPNEKQRRKKWVGTVSGRLSHYSGYLFVSGSKTSFNKPAWWTLMYPKVTPFVISNVYHALGMEKQKAKMKNEKRTMNDQEQFKELLGQYLGDEALMQTVDLIDNSNIEFENVAVANLDQKKSKASKRRNMTAPLNETSKKLIKIVAQNTPPPIKLGPPAIPITTDDSLQLYKEPVPKSVSFNQNLLDPMCHYNTSLNSISRLKMLKLATKLTGGIRKEMILSPYSGIYLKPYVRQDTQTFPHWLKMMAELQLTTNKSQIDYVLPPRSSIDYTYVQPEHIPAINSLCNQFFWPGIDLTESLQYPDYSCVAMYKRLIVGFAFIVPNVQYTENYISFVLTRPGWRNSGMGKFMIYHLIQTSLGKDITLHVAIDNPALFLYQKFGFKVENVVLDFYDKYFRDDTKGSKHAFFCRLER
ncbi:cysteine-rich protein 2-binding protein [Euwallacea fornicatus]|uniref:cysteine-rich protein 2-binding protein n=1 Tax=Euwallacea fornicatus TaxID=995702 RepID=UPI00338F48ED